MRISDWSSDVCSSDLDLPEPSSDDVIRHLDQTGTEVLVNYLPVGSQQATEFFAECALRAGVAFVNAMPVFIASDPEWGRRFAEAGVPVIGADIKAQLGATIVHRVLTDLFARRGVPLDRTYQLNTGGNQIGSAHVGTPVNNAP